MRKSLLFNLLFLLIIIGCKTDKKQLQTPEGLKQEEYRIANNKSTLSDEYVIVINGEQPRLAKVTAILHPNGNLIQMNEFNEHGLENGWATFVQNLQVKDNHGRALKVIAKENSQWILQDYKEGFIKLSYQVRLEHDVLVPAIRLPTEEVAPKLLTLDAELADEILISELELEIPEPASLIIYI